MEQLQIYNQHGSAIWHVADYMSNSLNACIAWVLFVILYVS
jgi:hypothetical protein